MLRNFISKLPMLIKYWFLQRNEKPFPKFVLQRTRWVMGKMHAAGPQTLQKYKRLTQFTCLTNYIDILNQPADSF